MKAFLFILTLLTVISSKGQNWTLHTQQSTSKTMLTGTVKDLFQDSKGNMWFAGGDEIGLSKFDGANWTIFTIDSGLCYNNVYDICEDKLGNLWFATSYGISKYNGKFWTTFKPDLNVNKIAFDPSGLLWAATSTGIWKFDGTNWTNYNIQNSSLPKNDCRTICFDSKGNAWIGIFYGGVAKFDGVNWKIYNNTNGLFGNIIYTIAIDAQDNVWTGGLTCSLSKFDGSTWKTYTTTEGLPDPTINDIAFDNQGKIWLGTNINGAVSFDGTNFTKYLPPAGLAGETIYSIWVDKANNKWFGTAVKGASKYDGVTWTTFAESGLSQNDIINISTGSDDKTWFCTTYGLSSYDGTTWSNNMIAYHLLSSAVTANVFDKAGNQWIGTANGIVKITGNTYKHITTSDGLLDNNILCLAIDARQNIWAGTYSGICMFDGTKWINYSQVLNSSTITYSIVPDAAGNIWTTFGYGLWMFNGKSWFSYGYGVKDLVSYATAAVSIDIYGNKWVASKGGGLFKFDGLKWTNYKPGTTKTSNTLIAVAIDAEGNKWVTSETGIYKLEGNNWKNFSNYPGLTGKRIKTFSIDGSGNKWIGTDFYGVFQLQDGGPGYLKISKIQRGMVFHDINSNGKKDIGESNITGQIVKVDNNFIATQADGTFYTSLTKGTHKFFYNPSGLSLTTDSIITVLVTDNPITDTVYFGLKSSPGLHNLKTSLSGSFTRIGFTSKYWISCNNSGYVSENGTLSFEVDPKAIILKVTPAADSIIGKRIVWKFTNLLPFQTINKTVELQMPGFKFLGDTLTSKAKAVSQFTSHTSNLKQVLTGSYDPNDKLVDEGYSVNKYVLLGSELNYTIRFQNTGTDTAFNIVVKDTLDAKMDLQSLKIVGSSHPVRMEIKGINEMNFIFDNILLPDSNKNKVGSNGFVKYTIKPIKNLSNNSIVKNKAAIYFDFNPAIITNHTLNTYVTEIPKIITGNIVEGMKTIISAYPNPCKETLNIAFPTDEDYNLVISDLHGVEVARWEKLSGGQQNVSIINIKPSVYLFSAQSKSHNLTGKLIKTE